MVCEGRLVTFQVLHQEKSVVGAKVRKYIILSGLRIRGVHPGLSGFFHPESESIKLN
jgi:hypothetical protein